MWRTEVEAGVVERFTQEDQAKCAKVHAGVHEDGSICVASSEAKCYE